MQSTETKRIPPAPAPYLHRFEHWIEDVGLTCWLEYEPADKSVGMAASAWLVHAYVGDSGMDIVDLLLPSIVEFIEDEAVEYFGRE